MGEPTMTDMHLPRHRVSIANSLAWAIILAFCAAPIIAVVLPWWDIHGPLEALRWFAVMVLSVLLIICLSLAALLMWCWFMNETEGDKLIPKLRKPAQHASHRPSNIIGNR